MQATSDKTKLMDAMVLLELADKMYPSIDHFFSKYTTSELITAAHDLIQNVHSDGECPFNSETYEVLATLEGARRYMDLGGHLWQPSGGTEEPGKISGQAQGMLGRILARIGLK
ncbi:hypothetical protein [Noviherbaspirillum pedocola]|uniref:Uncharacterized protein n=1 Tax=Noviherbaspirillum pedocola TaxID=2801341 RepID=A0A934W8X8_9BURK|nr:hypothetical protein [Noviherbaspirillum pedocola]MBK4737353.1 hypothetical protein [Noviherbaspirillum pedocola]